MVGVLDEADDLVFHEEVEVGVLCGLGGEEVEEVPLRHESDELFVGGGGGVRSGMGKYSPPMARTNSEIRWWGRARKASRIPSSYIRSRVEGWMVSPRKSRKKSLCFSRTVTSWPSRARR